MSHANLLAGFRALIHPKRISLGHKLRRIIEYPEYDGPNIRIDFTNDTCVFVDCVLGADGIHSVTRSYLLRPLHPATEPKNHDDWQIYRTMVSTEEAKTQINHKWTTSVPILIGPKGYINCILLSKNTRVSASVAVRGAKFTSNGCAPPLGPALFADYSEDAQKIVRMVAKDTTASWTLADHGHAPIYAHYKVAMLGDAAHASLPFAGNGVAQALEDAAVLNCLFDDVKERRTIAYAL